MPSTNMSKSGCERTAAAMIFGVEPDSPGFANARLAAAVAIVASIGVSVMGFAVAREDWTVLVDPLVLGPVAAGVCGILLAVRVGVRRHGEVLRAAGVRDSHVRGVGRLVVAEPAVVGTVARRDRPGAPVSQWSTRARPRWCG